MEKIDILLADDHNLFRKGMVSLIEDIDFVENIYEACDGVECLEIMRKTEIPPQLILLDLKMPNLDGMDTTNAVHSEFPGTKIIILSMQDDERFILHMIEQGVNGYLLKNSDPEELEKAIKSVVENDYYFNQKISQIMQKGLIKKNSPGPGNHTDFNLSPREIEILKLICCEFTAKEVADKLNISHRTVEGHKKNMQEKTGAKNTAGLVIFAIKHNLVELC